MAWLTASPVHLREYLAIGRTASALDELLQSQALDVEALLRAPPRDNVVALPVQRSPGPSGAKAQRASAKRPPRKRLLALAACLAIMAIVASRPQGTEFRTARGQPARFTLSDGTVMHLNGASAARVRMGWFRRDIVLHSGQASFVVATDRRPLQVRAAGLSVRDIGTTFDVDLLQGHARIGVEHGQVQIASGTQVLADLRAGQSVRVDYGTYRVTHNEQDPQASIAWWQGRIVFRDQALSEVAERFNRINTLQVRIDDVWTAALPLTGNLRGVDLASLRAFLQQHRELSVCTANGELHVGRKPDAHCEQHAPTVESGDVRKNSRK